MDFRKLTNHMWTVRVAGLGKVPLRTASAATRRKCLNLLKVTAGAVQLPEGADVDAVKQAMAEQVAQSGDVGAWDELCAVALDGTVVQSEDVEPMTLEDWGRLVVRSRDEEEPVEGLPELIAMALRRCGFTASVEEDSRVHDGVAEAAEALEHENPTS